MKILLHIFILLVAAIGANSQDVPAARLTNWSQVRTHFQPNFPSQVLNILDYDADSTGQLSCHIALGGAISDAQAMGGAVIYFPRGQYFFQERIQLPSNISLEGESAELTTLRFDLNGNHHLITVRGSATALVAGLAASAARHDSLLWVSDGALFSVGDLVLVLDNDTAKVTSEWAIGTTGQLVYIKSIDNQAITLESPLRRDFDVGQSATIRKILPSTNVQIAHMTIERLDTTTTQRSNIFMDYAANCKVSCIKSYNGNFAHVTLNSSCNIQVEGSYFQDATGYGNGGQGYGVVLQYHTGECLIYNNIFSHLRHAMLLQAGVNGNVLAYNYSNDPFWTDVGLPSYAAGDLVLHGNYPYCNLFEGNIVQNIVIDDSHGQNGPYNTFLRNRAELYGIFMNNNPPSGSQHFLSNEITNDSSSFGFYFLNGSDHFAYGNMVKGMVKPIGTTLATPFSYYLSAPPSYYDTLESWPPMGSIDFYNMYQTESKNRYWSEQLTACSPLPISTSISEHAQENICDIKIFPNPAENFIYFHSDEALESVIVTDVTGMLRYHSGNTISHDYQLNIQGLPSGIFYVQIMRCGSGMPILYKGVKY